MFRFLLVLVIGLPAVVVAQQLGEDCFNGIDDDQDGLIDLNDGDCDCGNLINTEMIGPNLIENGDFEQGDDCLTAHTLDCSVEGWVEFMSSSTMQVFAENRSASASIVLFEPGNEVYLGGGSGFEQRAGSPNANGSEGMATTLLGAGIQKDSVYRFQLRLDIIEYDHEGPDPATAVRNFAVYGGNSPPPVQGSVVCAEEAFPQWTELGVFALIYSPTVAWEELTLTFTSPGDFRYFAFAASCTQTLPETTTKDSYYWVADSLRLQKITRVPTGEEVLRAELKADERATCATELTLEANAGNYNYYWYRNNQFIGAENTPRLTVERTELERENYTVLILNSRECSRSAPFRPRPPDEVAITETTNKISCQGANDGGFSINFPDSLDYLRFVWEDAMGNRVGEGTTVSDLGPGDYTLLAIDPGGCALPFTYRLREPDSLRAAAISIDANCTQNTGLGELRLSATGGTWPFQYRVAGQSYFDEDTLQLEPGNYLVEVWDINNCPSQAQEVNIGGYEPFHIEITPSSGAPELGDVLQLRLGSDRPTGNLDIRWSSDNPELNFNPLPSSPRRPPGIELSPLQAHTYRVFVRDPLDGCQRIDSLYIPVVTKRKIYLPTVFSPNGDGINDSFGPLTGSGVVTISNFAIFDRWGREVFNSPSGASWSGEDMPSGTYAYYFIASFLDGSEKRYRGSIVLLR